MEKTRETIHLDSKAQQRLYVLTHVLAGEVTVAQAAAVLRLSARQVDRLAHRFRDDGAAALVQEPWSASGTALVRVQAVLTLTSKG